MLKCFLVAAASFLLCLALLVGWYLRCLFIPIGSGKVVRNISLPAGASIKKLAEELEKQGIIRSSRHFVLASRLTGDAKRFKAGNYRLSNAMTTTVILRKIANGETDFIRFTLPEGYSMYQAAELLQKQGIMTQEAFLNACRDRKALSTLGIKGSSVEGYLFPATYDLAHDEEPERLISRMTAHFEKMYSQIRVGAPKAGGMSRHEVVTLASMIEKEAVFPVERPVIASVFQNRLKLGMRLQSDPTAVYGVKTFGWTVTKADILRPSPYNTYLNAGLPPGPIGNPGTDALRAVLYPAKTPYLYFVARRDGTHQFSRTLEEHNQAVRKYLK